MTCFCETYRHKQTATSNTYVCRKQYTAQPHEVHIRHAASQRSIQTELTKSAAKKFQSNVKIRVDGKSHTEKIGSSLSVFTILWLPLLLFFYLIRRFPWRLLLIIYGPQTFRVGVNMALSWRSCVQRGSGGRYRPHRSFRSDSSLITSAAWEKIHIEHFYL